MKKILVPVDFSQDSLTALNSAVWIAEKTEAEILLVHVNKVRSFPSFFTKTARTEKPEDIRHSFDELLQNTDTRGIKMQTIVVEGSVDGEIHKLANSNSPYLIVMGSHGASGHREKIAGSNAYKVINNATCPVMTTRGDYKPHGISKIVMPFDTSVYTRHKVPFTVELAKFFDAEIYVVAACMHTQDEFIHKAEAYASQACDYINDEGVRYHYETLHGDNVTDMTIAYAEKTGADLISIMTEQESSVSSFFMGAYAQQMVHHSPIPVLSMHKNPKLEGAFSIM